jgi:hypothetical protein
VGVAVEDGMRVFNSFILWFILLILCWPLALLALILYPFIWLLLLPFRLIGITVDAVFELLRTVLFLPARLLGARPREN